MLEDISINSQVILILYTYCNLKPSWRENGHNLFRLMKMLTNYSVPSKEWKIEQCWKLGRCLYIRPLNSHSVTPAHPQPLCHSSPTRHILTHLQDLWIHFLVNRRHSELRNTRGKRVKDATSVINWLQETKGWNVVSQNSLLLVSRAHTAGLTWIPLQTNERLGHFSLEKKINGTQKRATGINTAALRDSGKK